MGEISSGLLGFVLLLFLLPWMTVSCSGQKVFTFSGTDLAIGKTVQVPQAFAPPKKENTREWKATVAFLAAVAGTLAGFLVKVERIQKIVLISCGGIGGILLFLLRSKLNSDIFLQGGGMIIIDYHFAFWLSMLLFFGVGILNTLSLAGVLDNFSSGAMSSSTFKGTTKPFFCSQCGAKVSQEDTFCSGCGHSLK